MYISTINFVFDRQHFADVFEFPTASALHMTSMKGDITHKDRKKVICRHKTIPLFIACMNESTAHL